MFTHQCLQTHLSIVRWESYKQTPQEAGADIWQRYQENLRLSQKVYPFLHFFEIVLRNHLQPILHTEDPQWFEGSLANGNFQYRGTLLKSNSRRQLNRAYSKLSTNKIYMPSQDLIIAELTLGFWVELLSHHYSKELWVYNPQKSDNLKLLFPNLTAQNSPYSNNIVVKTRIYPRLKAINILRNRVFHHEPIWRKENFNCLPQDQRNRLLQDTNSATIDFNLIFKELQTVLGWFCPDLLQDIQSFKH